MRLTIVGCSGSYPGPEGPASCYLLEQTDGAGRIWRIVVDMGNGALGALHKYADPLAIDAVLLSHLHVDHCVDLTSYYVLRKYHPRGAQPQIPVYGPAGTARRMARAYDLPEDPGMSEEFDFHSYGTDSFAIGPFTVTAIEVDHPVEAYGLRVEAGGASLAYTGDTGPTDALLEVAHDVDLLLAEASFRDDTTNPESVHLTGVEGGEVATKAGVRRLVLTHIPPWHDPQLILAEARPAYSGPLELAVPGAVYDL